MTEERHTRKEAVALSYEPSSAGSTKSRRERERENC